MYHNEQQYEGKTNVWLTPRWLIDLLGPFDCDPCAADPRPWDIGETTNITETMDGLLTPWNPRHFVFINPPYGPHVKPWAEKLAAHPAGGVLLIYARTETVAMQRALSLCNGVFFLNRRITFLRGEPPHAPGVTSGGAPSMVLAYGREAVNRLHRLGIKHLGLKFTRDDPL